jgi:pimeloyl-ACP methyl ester carboxylesterase
MLISDLRGHGKTDLAGPSDVGALTSDLDIALAEVRFDPWAVMGYSHGGTVARRLAHTRSAVLRMILACTYACNVATLRERIEANVPLALLGFLRSSVSFQGHGWTERRKNGEHGDAAAGEP